jgi:hypothetical protein
MIYSLYGMQISVHGEGDEALPAVAGTSPAGVILRLRQKPAWIEGAKEKLWYQSPREPAAAAAPTLRVTQFEGVPFFRFRYWDSSDFIIQAQGREVWAEWPAEYDLSYAATYIMGPVMGYTLRLHGITTLHASVIEMHGRALVIMGNSGAGKSSTAAAFAKLGYAVLSDDLAPIRQKGAEWSVAPGYPRICLWPASVQFLFGSEDALPLITAGWEKRYLGLAEDNGHRFCASPQSLGAIYWLGDRTGQTDAPIVQGVGNQEALMGLVANTYAAEWPDLAKSSRDLRVYATLLRDIPVRRVLAHPDPARIFDLCEAIARDFEQCIA